MPKVVTLILPSAFLSYFTRATLLVKGLGSAHLYSLGFGPGSQKMLITRHVLWDSRGYIPDGYELVHNELG